MIPNISQAIEYSPETGLFRWKISPSRRFKPGDSMGTVGRDGYVQMQYRGRKLIAHRLAWFLMTGAWPPHQIDHCNCIKTDNRWCNLRSATPSQNGANKRPHGKFPKGVTRHRGGKFQAQIGADGRRQYLGLFSTPEEAGAAYASAAEKFFGEFARTA